MNNELKLINHVTRLKTKCYGSVCYYLKEDVRNVTSKSSIEIYHDIAHLLYGITNDLRKL